MPGPISVSLAESLLGRCLAMGLLTLGEMIIYPAQFLFTDTLAGEALRGSCYGAQNRRPEPYHLWRPADPQCTTEHAPRPRRPDGP